MMQSTGGTATSDASRTVCNDLQEQFATLSGDRNPMHMDPVAARRTQAGLPVVHGVHTLLWALESACETTEIIRPGVRIKVKFLKWVYLGDYAILSLSAEVSTKSAQVKVEVLGMAVLWAELLYEEEPYPAAEAMLLPSPAFPIGAALSPSFTDLKDRSGDAFTPTTEGTKRLFPQLCAAIGARAVAEMAACSYVVGMEVPGLHSMFSKLELKVNPGPPSDACRTALHYQVIYLDERFRKLRIGVTGSAIAGTLEAFVRVPPVEQASMPTIAGHVHALEFAGMNALIVGGSRGLGELTAKLIAAGGGTSTITYAVGKTEAENVARQVRDWHAEINVIQYDVRRAPMEQLAGDNTIFTHLFYFATNAIFRPKSNLVSPTILKDFIAFYLQGFHDLCLHLTEAQKHVAISPNKLIVYYPSSVAVEQRPPGMTEYAMIKAAGEEMCRDINQYFSNIGIITTRLPRLLTDQTASVLPERELDPVQVLLPIIREMRRLSEMA